MAADRPFFTEEERRALAALADCVLPPDDLPGGAALGAAGYIEELLTAMESDPPRVYAGGPFSGRQPYPGRDGRPSRRFPDNEFRRFLPLTRAQELGWRLRLYGSAGVPGGGPNDAVLGPVLGLRDRVRDGLREAMRRSPAPLERLDAAGREAIWEALDPALREALTELVIEAALGAPEYGGNRDLLGWRLAGFEGDTQPYGFSAFDEEAGVYRDRHDRPLCGPDPGPDPAPLCDETRGLLDLVALFLGGRKFH